jgi:hypothetical protein
MTTRASHRLLPVLYRPQGPAHAVVIPAASHAEPGHSARRGAILRARRAGFITACRGARGK